MIQRKQTLFLIIIIALFVSMFFMDLVTRECVGATPAEDATYSVSVSSLYPLAALGGLIAVICAVTIGLFKKSSLQLRLTVFNIILILGFIGFEIYSICRFYQAPLEAQQSSNIIGIAAFFPLLSLLFAFLAFRGIAKDIFLLRSFNRMR